MALMARVHRLRSRPRPRSFVLSVLPPGRRGRSPHPHVAKQGTEVERTGSPHFVSEGTDSNYVQAR